MHPVDRAATRIWFAFWPLELAEALAEPGGTAEMARIMDLEGDWKLENHIDDGVGFLYGAHHWRAVKKAALAHVESDTLDPAAPLAQTIEAVAKRAAEDDRVDVGIVLGIAAVALMILRRVGIDALGAVADKPAEGPLLSSSPDQIVSRRKRQSRDGVTFLKGVNRKWDVVWDERRKDGRFRAINGQDLAMASAEKGDYRELDYRRTDGPIPVECRSGSCGYCWVGVISGGENLSAISRFERERLRYFGYDTINEEGDSHPPIRLSCQSECRGDVTLAIAPWNGELNRRHDEGPKKLGTS
jgi:ferredoxin